MERDDQVKFSDFISTHEAATLLGISYSRMYDYIRSERIPTMRKGHMLFIPREAVERFRFNPPGRTRKRPLPWRTYNSRSKLLRTDIQVQVRPNQQDAFVQKLQNISKAKQYLFTGSVQRYILRDVADPTSIEISIVWKDTEMPDEAVREEELAAFKAELADVLDWETARYSYKEGIIYT